MKKSKVTRSLLAACSIVALSAVMYGCVHSGDGDPPAMTGEPDPDPAIAERAAIKSAIDAARTAVGAVGDASTDAELTAADTAIAAAKKAIADAANVPAEEKSANTGTVGALEAQLTAAKASRTAAMDAAAAAARMAAIDAAKDMLAEKEEALAALADDATDEAKRDAHRMVEAAANALRDTLRANGGSDADIEAAIRRSATAKVAADALQETITAAANAAERMRMEAISAAETTLSDAEKALEALGEDATDKQKRDAHRAVEGAAANLITVLQANEGTADQIEAATMKRNSAKMMADELTSPIEIADQRKAITDALAAAATAVAAVDDDATDAQVKAADDAIKTLREAIAAATALPEAERTAYNPAANAHASALETAKGSRDKAIAARDKDQQDKQRIANNKAGELVAAAIVKANDEDTNYHDGTAIGSLPSSLMASSYTATHKDGTTTIALRRSTGVKLTAMNTMSPGDGWTGKKFSFDKNQGAVFTNLGPAAVMVEEYSYDEFFSTTADDSKIPGVARDAEGVLTLGAVTGLKGSHFTVSTTLVPARPAKGVTPNTNEPHGTDSRDFKGSFQGVPGTFTCASDCSVTRNADDELTIAGALTFKPTLATDEELSDINVELRTETPDNDYLRFGYWMVTSGSGDNLKHTISTFADSMNYGDLAAAVSTLEGKATYSGAAAGLYVRKTGPSDSVVVTHGEFVADAALTAQFGTGDGTVALADTFSVTGTVSGFMPSTGDDDLSDWTLMLSKANLASARGNDGTPTVANADFAGFTGKTSGGTGTMAGDWAGTFVGGAPADTDTDTTDDYPTAAFGVFNGHFSNGHVAGAFGAEKD